MAWKSTDDGTTHAGVHTFHRLGDTKTRVTAQIDWQPEGLVEKAGQRGIAAVSVGHPDLYLYLYLYEHQPDANTIADALT